MRFGNARLYFTLPKIDENRANIKSGSSSSGDPMAMKNDEKKGQKARDLKFRPVPAKSILTPVNAADFSTTGMSTSGSKKRPLSATDIVANEEEDVEDEDEVWTV